MLHCACGQLKMGSAVELDEWWAYHRLGLTEPIIEHLWLAWVGYLLRVLVLGRFHDAHRTLTHAARDGVVLASAHLRLREPLSLRRPDLARSSRRVVNACGHVRRTSTLGLDYTRACLRAPRAHSLVNGDGELIELIRTRRHGRPGWVRVDGKGPSGSVGRSFGKFYPTIMGASGLERYWVSGTGTWDASTTTHWASLTGGAGGASAPDAGDNAHVDANSGGGTITISAAVARSLDCTNAPATTIAFASSTLTIGDGSGGAFKLVANITVTNTAGTLSFVSTSNNGGTGWAVTTANKGLPNLTFNGAGGKWVIQDTSTCGSNTLTVTSGGFFLNAQTMTCGQFSGTGATTRTVDLTNGTVTCTQWSFATTTNLTFTSTGSAITVNATNTTNSFGSLTYVTATLNQLGSGTFAITGTPTFTTVTLTGPANKTAVFTTASTVTVTGTLKFVSNSAVNRVLIASSARGTQRTFACSGATVNVDNTAAAAGSSVDFMDITVTGSPTWTPLNSTLVGDAAGNGGAVTTNRTTPAAQTYNGTASDNYSTLARWTSRVPLPQDNVTVVAITAGTLTVDMPRLGANIDFTGTTRVVDFSSVANEFYGNWTFVSGMASPTGTQALTLAGRGAQTFTSGSKTFTQGVTVNGPGCTYTLQDAYAGTAVTITSGTIDANSQSVTTSGIFSMANSANAGLTMGTTTWTLSGTAALTYWSVFAANVISAASGTIVISTTSANTRTFQGGSKTYGTLTYTVAGSTGQLTITGSNTFSTINFSDASNARTLAFTAATTTNVTTYGGLNVVGTSGKLMSIVSTVGGSAATIAYAGGRTVNWASIQDITGTWPIYATNSTNVSGNTNIIFGSMLPKTRRRIRLAGP